MNETNLLTVVLGAGASYDCVETDVTDYDGSYRPPLTDQLFAFRGSFNAILNKYKKAEALSEAIRTRMKRKDNLEQILKELEARDSLPLKKQYWQIPLYLQELLWEVTKQYVRTGGTKFHTLVDQIATSKHRRVLFLTLNYDLFLEDALTRLYDVKFSDLADYWQDDHGWGLVKLHGSVNWGRMLLNPHTPSGDSVDALDSVKEELELGKKIVVLRGYQNNDRFVEGNFYYPALAVPLGKNKAPVCHETHIQRARDFLSSCSDFLVIGCSCMDADLLDLLGVVREVRKLEVVNGKPQDATEALSRIASRNSKFAPERFFPKSEPCFDGGFQKFVTDNQLRRFLWQ